MHCPNSMAPSDEGILQYIVDSKPLSREAVAHLRHCATCQERLANYQQIENYLVSRLYRSQCPSATQLNLYCADTLPMAEAKWVTEHSKHCPLCRNDIKDIQRILVEWENANAELFSQENR